MPPRITGSKDRIVFYAPPQISEIINKIISSGAESTISGAICKAISEYWSMIEERQVRDETNDQSAQIREHSQDIAELQAALTVISDRLAFMEQKYAMVSTVLAEESAKYRRIQRESIGK